MAQPGALCTLSFLLSPCQGRCHQGCEWDQRVLENPDSIRGAGTRECGLSNDDSMSAECLLFTRTFSLKPPSTY